MIIIALIQNGQLKIIDIKENKIFKLLLFIIKPYIFFYKKNIYI